MRYRRLFFPNWDFSRGFYILYIINFAGRMSEAAMGGAEAAQRPVLRVKKPINGRAQCKGAYARQKLYCIVEIYAAKYRQKKDWGR